MSYIQCPGCGQPDQIGVHRKRDTGTQYRCRACGTFWTMSNEPDADDTGNERTLTSPPQRHEPPTVAGLMAQFGCSPDEWEVERQTVNMWETTYQGVSVPLYQLKVWLVRREPIAKWPALQVMRHEQVAEPLPAPDYSHGIPRQVLVVPDMQVGYKRGYGNELVPLHDTRACDLVRDIIRYAEPDEVVLLGDMLDLTDWTDKFLVSPDFTYLTQPALNYLAEWIGSWREHTNRVTYLEGNHEKRLCDAIVRNIPAMYGLTRAHFAGEPPIYSVPFLLGLKDLNVDWVGDYPRGEYWINDNLRCTHAQKLGNRGGMTVGKSLIGARCSTIYGHAHRMETAHVTVRGRKGAKVYGSYCVGTLARIDGVVPSNAAEEDWQQGFAVVDVAGDWFNVCMYNIHEGKCVYDGKFWDTTNGKK
jgi:hypothetical protein